MDDKKHEVDKVDSNEPKSSFTDEKDYKQLESLDFSWLSAYFSKSSENK